MATLVSPKSQATAERATGQPRPNLSLSPLLAMVFLSISTVYFLLPLYWMIISSTKDTGDLFNSFGLWFGTRNSLWVNLTGLVTTENGIFLHWLLNSLIYAGVSAVIATLISMMSGYALAKFSFPGRNFSFSVILGALLVPTTALVLPLYLLMSRFSLTNTYWSVLLPSIVSPFGVYLARIYITSSVPTELIEAARVDGLDEVRTFFQIVMPLVRPAMITVFLFQFVAVWNNFFLPLVMLNDTNLYPVTLGLQTWYSRAGGASSNNLLYSLVVIGSLIAIIPLIAGFLTLQRYWRGGLAAGGVKG